MPRKLKLAVLLTLSLGFAADAPAQQQDLRIEIDPLLVDDTKGGPASSLKLIEIEFQVVTIDLGRVRSADMDRIRSLFRLTKSAVAARRAAYGLGGRNLQKLVPVSAEGPIKHQVLETKTFHDLLAWMADRHIASFSGHKGSKIALGSTVVVIDQRVSAPRISTKKDLRTGTDIHTVNFVQSGLHFELTSLSQVFPKQEELGEVWQLRLDRVFTTLTDSDEKSEATTDRVRHMVKLAVGQTALIPDFVQTDRPAFVLLSVKTPKRKPEPGLTLLTPTGEVIRLSKDPGGPGLADRISKTLTATEDTPTPRIYKLGPAKDGGSKPILVLANGQPVEAAGSAPARPHARAVSRQASCSDSLRKASSRFSRVRGFWKFTNRRLSCFRSRRKSPISQPMVTNPRSTVSTCFCLMRC